MRSAVAEKNFELSKDIGKRVTALLQIQLNAAATWRAVCKQLDWCTQLPYATLLYSKFHIRLHSTLLPRSIRVDITTTTLPAPHSSIRSTHFPLPYHLTKSLHI
jgi:hypothetical protein